MMNLQGKKVLVFGSGKSGIGAADLLEQTGATPVFTMETKRLIKKPYYIRFPITAGQKFTQANFPKKYRTAWIW